MSTGVLLTAFGGPSTLDEVGPFMERLMGRTPPRSTVAGAEAKYEAIGGGSPLPRIARRIATALESELAERGAAMRVRLGMRYSEPGIADALGMLADGGATRAVHVSLSPFESRITTRAYRTAIEAASGSSGVVVTDAPPYFDSPGMLDLLAEAAASASGSAGPDVATLVVFTAHSLPCEEVADDDTYVRQLRDSADAVALRAGWAGGAEGAAPVVPEAFGATDGARRWLVAYQSRGRRECEWLQPELGPVLDGAAAEGYEAVALCPLGFVTDHMETLYDLDVAARRDAEAAGLAFARAAVPNDAPAMIDALADAVLSALQG